MMNLSLKTSFSLGYKSPSQRVRVVTEQWMESQAYCPSCGRQHIVRYGNNAPVADFACPDCGEDYELKSTKQPSTAKIMDGAYLTMIERLRSTRNPNLFLLSYDMQRSIVRSLVLIPKHFFVPDVVEMRKPLSPSARRRGWVGCNIVVRDIPQAGRIFLIRDHAEQPKEEVISQWRRTLFLRQASNIVAKGWLLDIMKCIEGLGQREFSLDDLYAFEPALHEKYPQNKHIRDKIRQQLQILRDKGYLAFAGGGRYRLLS